MDRVFFNKLLDTPSVSGFESGAANLYLDYLQPGMTATSVDVMGNAYAYLKGTCGENNKKFLIEAHIDEIGFQVIYVNDAGYVYVRRNGGVDLQCIPGSQVVIYTAAGEEITGVIGKMPIHLVQPEERKKTIELDNLWIDTGLAPDEVKARVSIGDVVAWKSNAVMIGNNRIASKGLDDKIGVFVVSQVMKRLAIADRRTAADVWGVASVQEEVGCRGAVVCGYKVAPDIAISIDVDFATDVPCCSKQKFGDIALGKGVVVRRNLDTDSRLTSDIVRMAKDCGIPFQVSACPMPTGGTNAARIQLSRDGVRMLSLGIPCRYMHTPVEVCDMTDVEAAIDLVVQIVGKL